MEQRTKPTVGFVIGIILLLGPLWGMIGTILSMKLAFKQPQPQVETMASNIGLALYPTVIGLIACPIGIVTIIVSAIKRSKTKNPTEGLPNITQDDIRR